MEQYEKSAPVPLDKATPADQNLENKIKRLEETVSRQDRQIQDLITEIRRLKGKLDAHAANINQMQRDG